MCAVIYLTNKCVRNRLAMADDDDDVWSQICKSVDFGVNLMFVIKRLIKRVRWCVLIETEIMKILSLYAKRLIEIVLHEKKSVTLINLQSIWILRIWPNDDTLLSEAFYLNNCTHFCSLSSVSVNFSLKWRFHKHFAPHLEHFNMIHPQ